MRAGVCTGVCLGARGGSVFKSISGALVIFLKMHCHCKKSIENAIARPSGALAIFLKIHGHCKKSVENAIALPVGARAETLPAEADIGLMRHD